MLALHVILEKIGWDLNREGVGAGSCEVGPFRKVGLCKSATDRLGLATVSSCRSSFLPLWLSPCNRLGTKAMLDHSGRLLSGQLRQFADRQFAVSK